MNRGSIHGRGKVYFSPKHQTGFHALTFSYSIGTGGPFPKGQSDQGVKMVTHIHTNPNIII
jgi:hypothetical protein